MENCGNNYVQVVYSRQTILISVEQMAEWGPRAGLDFMDKRRNSYRSHTLQSSPTGLSLTIVRYIKVVKALLTNSMEQSPS
jgi:hypothetical protein